jgi:hypothetical protein
MPKDFPNDGEAQTYTIYNDIRARMFRLLDASFGTERKRTEHYFSSIKEYEVDSVLYVGSIDRSTGNSNV